MTDPVQILLQQEGLRASYFSPTSRYFGLEIRTFLAESGDPIVYVRQRFIPPPERFQLLQEHAVRQGERMDNIANRYLGDPEQYWRICDANAAMDPNELTDAIGRRIRITLPEGLPGTQHAERN